MLNIGFQELIARVIVLIVVLRCTNLRMPGLRILSATTRRASKGD